MAGHGIAQKFELCCMTLQPASSRASTSRNDTAPRGAAAGGARASSRLRPFRRRLRFRSLQCHPGPRAKAARQSSGLTSKPAPTMSCRRLKMGSQRPRAQPPRRAPPRPPKSIREQDSGRPELRPVYRRADGCGELEWVPKKHGEGVPFQDFADGYEQLMLEHLIQERAKANQGTETLYTGRAADIILSSARVDELRRRGYSTHELTAAFNIAAKPLIARTFPGANRPGMRGDAALLAARQRLAFCKAFARNSTSALAVLCIDISRAILDELGVFYTRHRLKQATSVLSYRKLAADLLCRAAELADCEKERALVQATLQEPPIEQLVGQLVSQGDEARVRALMDAGMEPNSQGAASCIQGRR